MRQEDLVPYLDKTIDPKLQKLRVSIYEQMIVHTRGLLPERLLKKSRPNEPEEVKEYRLNNYEPTSRDPIIRALNSTYHLIKQSDYKVVVGEKTLEYLAVKKFESYITTNKLNLVDLMFRSFLQLDVEDPNGVLLWKAVHPIDRSLVPDSLPSTMPIDIESEYICSDRIVYLDEKVLIYKDSYVIVDKASVMSFMVVNDTDIYRNVPIRKDDKGKYIYELQPYYKHNFGFLPYRILGGIETIREYSERERKEDKERNKFIAYGKEDEDIKYQVYDSFFTAYNSWANKYIVAQSECDAVKVMSSFPIIEIADTVCSKCKGQGSYFPDDCFKKTCNHTDKNLCSNVSCGDCKGTGTISAFSPFTVIKRKPQSTMGSELPDTRPTVQYFMPPLEAVEVNKVYAQDMWDKAEQCLAIYQTINSQSGVAKEIDLEQKKDQIAIIADNLMNLYEFSLRCIAFYLKDTVVIPYVIKPTRYEIRNSQNILEEIKNVKVISPDLAKGLMLEYIDKEYSGNDRKVMELLVVNDDFYGWTSEEIAKEKAMSVGSSNVSLFDETMFKFHRQGYRVLSKIIKADENNTLTEEQILAKAFELLK